MAWLDKRKEEVIQTMQEITSENMEKLAGIWAETVDRKSCGEHLMKMIEHITTFYQDIMQESLERRDRFAAAIAEREEEASELSRLLKVDVPLSPIKGLPLHTALVKLENNLQDLRKQLKERKDEIIQLLLEQETLCEDLDESPRELPDDPLPSEKELDEFREHLIRLKEEKIRRKVTIDELRKETRGYMKDLEIFMDSTIDTVLLDNPKIPVTKATISQICTLRDDYRHQVEQMRDSINKMKTKVETLWNYLEVSFSVRQKFTKYVDYTQTTFDKYYQELERCEGEKKQNIKKFVDRLRNEIVEWWEKTLKSDTERARFVYFTCETYNEDLLTLLEMELEVLQNFYHTNVKIFELIEQRSVLWDRMTALEAKASEPGRYNNRGGQLLKEEKERKTIATKLPKIEAELKELVTEFETSNGSKFLVFGEDIVEKIARDWETKKVEKEKLMSARKNAVGGVAGSKTPMSTSKFLRTPLSAKNHSTMRLLSSSTKVSTQATGVKRKLLHPESCLPNAKRSLMHELGSPMPSTNKTPFKTPNKKTRVIATTIRRKSGRVSGNLSKNKRKSTHKSPMKAPRLPINPNRHGHDTTTSDTVSYDLFENYIAKDPSCRSSVMVDDSQRPKISTRSRLMRGPSPGPSCTPPHNSRKLTTKNLPILM